MLKVKLEPGFRIGRDALYSVPPQLLSLLNAIHRTGSLQRAIRDVDVSYRHAWGLLGRWEAITGHKLASFTRGHGTSLTAFGARLAQAGEWMEGRIRQWVPAIERELLRHLDVPVDADKATIRVHASNDIALAKLKERLQGRLVLDLRFEGSLHSLDSLARGDCDLAGFHMPQPASLLGPLAAEFRARLNGREHRIACLFARHQGLMVGTHAKTRVRKLGDLAKPGVRFVNRERGSGTRLLLDALLAREGVDPSAVDGYEHEEFTHMATAATVRAGMADAAFGIEAAAREHGLKFVEVVSERYYIAAPRKPQLRVAVDAMVAAAQSASFQRAIQKIGGYEFETTGNAVRLSELFAAAKPPAVRRRRAK